MALPKLAIPPDQGGYKAQYGNEILSVKLDGGASRFRRDIIGAAHGVPVTWTLSRDEFNYVVAFFRALHNGVDPFLVDLMIDSPDLLEYEVHFLPGTFTLARQTGLTYVLTAELEVAPRLSPNIPRTQYVGYQSLTSGYAMDRFNEWIGKYRTPPGDGFIATAGAFGLVTSYNPSTYHVVVYEARSGDGEPGSLLYLSDAIDLPPGSAIIDSWEQFLIPEPWVLASDTDYYLGVWAKSIPYAYHCGIYSGTVGVNSYLTTRGEATSAPLDPFPLDEGRPPYNCAPCVYLRTAVP